jgi:hypothetical protein
MNFLPDAGMPDRDGAAEDDTDGPFLPEATHAYEPLTGDLDAAPAGHSAAVDGPCFMCKYGPVEGHPGVEEVSSVMGRVGELSNRDRYMTAATVQCRLDATGQLEPAHVARMLHAHDKHHVLDTKTIAGENLQLLRTTIGSLRQRMQCRDLASGQTSVHADTLNMTLRAMKMQLEWLRCKHDGLPFTRASRASVRAAAAPR